jgi:hypothetical protein
MPRPGISREAIETVSREGRFRADLGADRSSAACSTETRARRGRRENLSDTGSVAKLVRDGTRPPGFAERYVIPPENVANADFIESAVVRPGSPFVTRPAPDVGPNGGGGIEVVVPGGGVRV